MSYATGRRRFLSLPAVQPGGEVSPAALAHSLASLADEILALRDATFPVHRRSAREAIRQVGAIREFLADVAPASLHRGGAAVALSELHIALQKLGNLLRDCARPGARLWVLMHSEQVSNDFRALIKSVSTALDVLPLSATDASPEVKELVRLVAEQGWKAEVGTAPADSLTARDVGSAIVHFENGIAPNPIDLERIMEQLRIRSWSDCNEEILFLEDLSSSSADVDVGEQKEAALVSSLTALMVYCRVTLFDGGDDGKSGGASQQNAPPPPRAMNQVMNLDDLRCPISYELMLDPVTIATGHTYDRASISKWFRSGSLTCPVTGEKLTDAAFVPNSTVRYFVEQLYRSNNLPFPEPSSRQRNSSKSAATPPDSVAAAEATKMVAALLVSKLASSARREQRKAASEIRKLTKSNVFNRACMVNAGAVPWLLHLLSSREASTQDDAVAALLNLSKHPSGGRAIVDAGGLGVVVDVIRVALKVESQQNAAAILFYLSSVEDCPAEIGNMPDAIPTLVELVREGTYRGKKNAVVTLFGLLLCHSNRARMLEAGAVPALIALLPSQQRGDLASDAVAVLAKISEQPDGAAAIVGCAAGIPRLVEFFRSTGSRSGRENCMSALLSLCVHGGAEVVSSLSQMPALMPALYSLATEGSPRAGKKARSLIDRIHHLDEQGWPAMAASSVQDDGAVHTQ